MSIIIVQCYFVKVKTLTQGHLKWNPVRYRQSSNTPFFSKRRVLITIKNNLFYSPGFSNHHSKKMLFNNHYGKKISQGSFHCRIQTNTLQNQEIGWVESGLHYPKKRGIQVKISRNGRPSKITQRMHRSLIHEVPEEPRTSKGGFPFDEFRDISGRGKLTGEISWPSHLSCWVSIQYWLRCITTVLTVSEITDQCKRAGAGNKRSTQVE